MMNTLVNEYRGVGNLGKDPEMTYSNKGTPITKFSIAENLYKGKGDDGKAKYETQWMDFVAFGKTAENIHKVLRKGMKVVVSAEVQKRRYEVDGKTRTAFDFVVNDYTILDWGKEGGSSGSRDSDGEFEEESDSDGGEEAWNPPF